MSETPDPSLPVYIITALIQKPTEFFYQIESLKIFPILTAFDLIQNPDKVTRVSKCNVKKLFNIQTVLNNLIALFTVFLQQVFAPQRLTRSCIQIKSNL